MTNETAILGYGPVGRATADRLSHQGRAFRVVQRNRPKNLAAGMDFRSADVLDLDALKAALAGASQVVVALGFPYVGKLWRDVWPRAMANVLAVAKQTGARIVFVDNLYMAGPQTAPLVETMPLTDFGVKPAVRSEVTRMWHASGVRVAALRAPDFYGPGVGNSHLGDLAFGALAKGKAATFAVSVDQPHDVAYVPDFGRGVVSLLDAPDDAFGQAWNLPCAPTLTLRRIFALGAAALGRPAKMTVLPRWSLAPLGLFMPILGEMREMQFQWDRPYRVDASKFAKRFWADATPFDIGAPATARSFLPAA